MPIQGRFEADFSQFQAACDAANVKLTSFQSNAGKVESSLTKMANSLSGTAMIQQATLMATAVDKIGGVSTLTSSELQRLGAQASEAIQKMQATGIREIPKNLQDIADAAKNAKVATSDLFGSVGSQLAGFATGALSVTGIVAFGRGVLEAGADVEKMAEQTGLTTERVQELSYIAGQTHTSIDALIGGVQNLEQRLGDDNTGAAAAMKRLGINAAAFEKLDTFSQLEQISDALKRVKDPTEQASDAAALFGKTWKEILPALKSDMEGLADAAPKMSEATTKALDDAEKNFDRFTKGVKVVAAETYNEAIELAARTINPLAHFQLAAYGAENDPYGAKSAAARVPSPPSLAAPNLSPLSLAGPQLAIQIDDLNEKYRVFHEASIKATDDAKKQGDALKELKAKIADLEHGLDGAGIGFIKFSEIGEKLTIKVPTLTEQIEALARAGDHVGASLLKAGGSIAGGGSTLADVQFGGIGITPNVSPSGALLETAKEKTQDWNKALSESSRALSELATVAGGTFGGIVKDLAAVVTAMNTVQKGLDAITKSGATSGEKLAGGLTAGAGFLSATSGGGLGAITGGAATGAEIGSVIPGIGTAVGAIAGALVGGIRDAIGSRPSKAELQTRQDRAAAGLDSSSIQTDESALTQLGISAQQAQILVARALDAKTPAAFAAAMKPVNDAIALNAKLQSDVTGVTSLVGAFVNAGHVLPTTMLATIQALAKMPGLTDDEKKSLDGLVASAKPNFDTLEITAEKYGSTLQGLGGKLAQGQLDQNAQGIYQDFEDLTNAGGDAGAVLTAMQGKLGDLVEEAEKSGAALPAFLKPLLGNFGDTIKDSQGNLVDLTKVSFDDTPTTDGLADMQKTVDGLQGDFEHGLPDAVQTFLASIPGNPFAGWQVPGLPTGVSVPGHAGGGYAAPGWALVGERGPELVNFPSSGGNVLTASDTRALFASDGGGGQPMIVETTIKMDGAVIAKQVDKYQKNAFLARGKRRAS